MCIRDRVCPARVRPVRRTLCSCARPCAMPGARLRMSVRITVGNGVRVVLAWVWWGRGEGLRLSMNEVFGSV
eukprot:12653028-Alexandrium_andersonii.AAC.1